MKKEGNVRTKILSVLLVWLAAGTGSSAIQSDMVVRKELEVIYEKMKKTYREKDLIGLSTYDTADWTSTQAGAKPMTREQVGFHRHRCRHLDENHGGLEAVVAC